MAGTTWIVYKAESKDAPQWEERKLMPSGGLTDILWENWSYEENPKIPQPGDRTREYQSDKSDRITHGRDGNWIVTNVHQFSSFDTDERIVICYCQFQPSEEQWKEIERGVSVDEILPVVSKEQSLV